MKRPGGLRLRSTSSRITYSVRWDMRSGLRFWTRERARCSARGLTLYTCGTRCGGEARRTRMDGMIQIVSTNSSRKDTGAIKKALLFEKACILLYSLQVRCDQTRPVASLFQVSLRVLFPELDARAIG